MKDLLMKFIIGFTFKVLIWRGAFANNNSVCDISTETGYLMANCSGRQLVDVPQNLDSNIEFLFLTNNTFARLNESSFARYPNLVLLSLQNTTYLDRTDPINYYTFRPLKRLELLLFNEISTPFNFSFHWPPSLRLISVNHNKFITDMDLSDLNKLQDVHALTYSLRDFPKFHILSPLTFLDLRGNPMDSLSAEDLAPFCTLNVLSLEWPQDAVINGSERFCQCRRLENWLTRFKIGKNGPLNCTPPNDADAETCSLEYSEETLSQRRRCLSRMVKSSVSVWFWIISGVVLLCPLIIVTFRETRAHQKSSLRSTTTTRKPAKFPNVELMIDMDEDFVDEDEDEDGFHDVDLFGHNVSEKDKKTSLHVKPEKNDLKLYELQENSREVEEEGEEEEKGEEEEEDDNEDYVRKDSKFEIEKFEGEQRFETEKKNVTPYPQKLFENIETKPPLRVKPHEDFEDEFDIDLLKYEKKEREKMFQKNMRKPSHQIKIHKELANKFSPQSPRNEQMIELRKEKVNFDLDATKMLKGEEENSASLRISKNFGEDNFSKISKNCENNESKLNDLETSTKDKETSSKGVEQQPLIDIFKNQPSGKDSGGSGAMKMSSPTSVEVMDKGSASNREKLPLRDYKKRPRFGNTVISVEGTPNVYHFLQLENEGLKTSDNTQSAIVTDWHELIKNAQRDGAEENEISTDDLSKEISKE